MSGLKSLTPPTDDLAERDARANRERFLAAFRAFVEADCAPCAGDEGMRRAAIGFARWLRSALPSHDAGAQDFLRDVYEGE